MRAFACLTLLSLTSLLGAGCDANWWDPSRFPPLTEQAPVFVTRDPGEGDFPLGRYGSVVVGYDTLLPDLAVVIPGSGAPNLSASRFAVSGGFSSPYYVWRGFEDRAISDVSTTGMRPRVDATAIYDACRDREYCGDGASASLAAFDVYPGGLNRSGDDFGCIAAPAGTVGAMGVMNERLNIRCETESTTILPVDVPDGIDFGASGAGLPALRDGGCAPRPHPVGFALFGAPRASDQTGALFVLTSVPEVHEVDLTGLTLPANSSLGAEMAAHVLDGSRVLVAVSARSEEGLADPKVVVVELFADASGLTAEVLACLGGAGASEGFGRALAIGDLDDDGSPEIAVGGGTPVEATSGVPEEPIHLFSYAALAGGRLVGCGGDTPPAPVRSVECRDVAGLTCSDASITDRTATGFGGSLAIGDIDGDGIGDLVTGVPFGRVNGISSGGVVTLAGASTLAMLGVGEGRQAVVAPSNARSGMLLGFAVSTMRGTDRDEIVAGAPGAAMASIFFCSGLRGDRPADLTDEAGLSHGCVVSATPGRPPICTGRDAGMSIDAGVPSDAGDLDAGDFDADLDAFVDPLLDAG